MRHHRRQQGHVAVAGRRTVLAFGRPGCRRARRLALVRQRPCRWRRGSGRRFVDDGGSGRRWRRRLAGLRCGRRRRHRCGSAGRARHWRLAAAAVPGQPGQHQQHCAQHGADHAQPARLPWQRQRGARERRCAVFELRQDAVALLRRRPGQQVRATLAAALVCACRQNITSGPDLVCSRLIYAGLSRDARAYDLAIPAGNPFFQESPC